MDQCALGGGWKQLQGKPTPVDSLYSAPSLFTLAAARSEREMPELGHGEASRTEFVPRLIEALSGAAKGTLTVMWTEAGRWATRISMGHAEAVVALAGKKVVGAAAGGSHTAVWTDTGELFTFGEGFLERLGH